MKIIDQLKKVNLIQFVPAIFVISLVGNSVFGYTAPKSEKSKNNSENQVEAATTQAKKKTKKANAGDIDLSKIKDGTYEGQANGYRGLVKVSVTVKDHKITAIKVLSNSDDAAFFNRASAGVIKNILAKQSLKVDVVSGATYSSNGIIKAVKNALTGEEDKSSAKAGGSSAKSAGSVGTADESGTSHWRECQTEGCTAKTDVAKHSGGQATYQKKAICSVCKISYGEVKKEDKAAKVATQIKKLDVKVSNLTMKKISEVQAARKAYNALSKKEKDTIKKDVSTLTKAETLIKQNNCGTNVYYRFSNNTLTIFGKGAIKNCFAKTTANMDIKRKVKNRIYKKYIPNVVNIVVEKGVTKIGKGAFACMPKLKTAQVQGNLGMAAFWGCANLEKVTYTNGAGTIGFACFAECKKLKSVAIPEGISAIDKSCFANCKKLKQINLPST